VDWLGWLWNDLFTCVAVAGLIVYVTVSGHVLMWWVSHHYAGSAATC
jgi:hypothetical protein